ncbi:putative nucleoside-diphosphate-sugar epimerase [Tirmania nivea]|nr:putative nucleoside-diphosphate-sugar epimerase [Tirmania nivea]
MAINVFITGASGYIGGTVLHTLAVEKHPELSYRALVRKQEIADKIRKEYKNVTPVIGHLDSLELLEEEASNADIVVNIADVDHTTSPPAILRGLSKPLPNDTKPPKNRFLIHTSGTSILNDNSFGTYITEHIYNDWQAVDELVYKLPDDAWHRPAEKAVLFNEVAPRAQVVYEAIICPPCIYGKGTGPGKVVSFQMPQLIKHFVKHGKGFTVNEGETVWGNVHVLDLAELYAALFDKALSSPSGTPEPGLWGHEGYFLAATGEHHWGDVQRLTAHAMNQKGLLRASETEKLKPEEVRQIAGLEVGPLIWGCNSRGMAERGPVKLGWRGGRGTRQPPIGWWVTGKAQGIGRREIDEEIKFYEDGLVL